MELNGFTGEKNFALWVKLVMEDKTVYEAEVYKMTGSGQAVNNPGAIEGVGGEEKPDDTTAGGDMPYAGAETTIFYIMGVVVLIGIIAMKKSTSLSDIM